MDDIILRLRRRTERRSKLWIQAWLDEGRELMHGHYHRFMHKLRYDDPASNLNYTRIQKKLCQCSVRTVAIRCTQWKRYERADTRLLERRRNAMELRRNAKVAMRTPWKRRENVMISPSS